MEQRAEQETDAAGTPPGFAEIATEYSMAGIDWSYYNEAYQRVAMFDDWPEGLALHAAWPGGGSWRVCGLWDRESSVNQLFAERVGESVAQTLQKLGSAGAPGGTFDVEPDLHAVVNFLLGAQSRSFVSIGPDVEGNAINVLGTQPVLVDLDVPEMTREQYWRLFATLPIAQQTPEHLIAHWAFAPRGESNGAGVSIREIWSDHAHALAKLGDTLLPNLQSLAETEGVPLACTHDTFDLRRLVIGEAAASACGV